MYLLPYLCTGYFVTARSPPPYPQPPLHSREGAMQGPTPAPREGNYRRHRFSKLPAVLKYYLSMHNVILLTIYYNTLSASYKRHSEKFATLRKIFASRDAQKFFKATLNFSKPRHLQLPANATNSAMHGILPRDARCYLINRKLNNLHCTLTNKYSITSVKTF